MSKIKPVRAWATLIGGKISPHHLSTIDDKDIQKHRWARIIPVIIHPVAKKRSKTCKKK